MIQTEENVTEEKITRTNQMVSFWVDGLRLGVPIAMVQEINRLNEITAVPGANTSIAGVVNLRGDVVTVLNARAIFASKQMHCENMQNIILQVEDESIGLLVDRVDDIVDVDTSTSQPTPPNIEASHRRFLKSVNMIDNSLILIVDPVAMIRKSEASTASA